MMNTQVVDKLLRASKVRRKYSLKVGERANIQLPSIPMTRFTEYVRLVPEKMGDINAFEDSSASPSAFTEGTTNEQTIFGEAIAPGELYFRGKAVDALTSHDIDNVHPMDFVINIHR